jgi:hypothetical protein
MIYTKSKHGEVSEWPKEHDWKSCILVKEYRGFESLSLLHFLYYINFICIIAAC